MRLQEWEVAIQEIVDECNHEQKERGESGQREISESGILMKWRAKLEKEPTLLQPFQIDEIMREVRQRLNNVGR